MKIEVTKDHLIDLIVGGITPPFGGCPYSDAYGDQHNTEWKWNRSSLSRLSKDELVEFYNKRRKPGQPLLYRE